MSELSSDERTRKLLLLLRNCDNREAGIPVVELPEHLCDEGLLTECYAANYVEIVRPNHSHAGQTLLLEPGYNVAELHKPDRKRVWQLLQEALTENVQPEIRHRIRLGKAGDVESARLERTAATPEAKNVTKDDRHNPLGAFLY